ncbi:hypothetical protein [Caminibacter pacificus]|uniref:Uncharacterized protein n=1 Tax=Caminibacter pacificus TaxID=1424653 RepID=A0AAJ4RDI7_9BACT|nr:hypothetical protein [Caminibacter pacificus]NPA87234.1 hypothetical protein [Campylobacterota bacterium]QCI28726.1 hypothetical protein C6V80_07040 [Caminibacter pacificus]ROR40540.1 hypothetical protein EDC58_0015 [Caminibacter pacificus]
MKELVELLRKEGIICKKLEEIKLNTRKKIKAFLGVNIKNEYCFIVVFEKKSRFLTKDIHTLEEIMPQINFRYKKKILILNSPICSKAKEKLKDWRILWF